MGYQATKESWAQYFGDVYQDEYKVKGSLLAYWIGFGLIKTVFNYLIRIQNLASTLWLTCRALKVREERYNEERNGPSGMATGAKGVGGPNTHLVKWKKKVGSLVGVLSDLTQLVDKLRDDLKSFLRDPAIQALNNTFVTGIREEKLPEMVKKELQQQVQRLHTDLIAYGDRVALDPRAALQKVMPGGVLGSLFTGVMARRVGEAAGSLGGLLHGPQEEIEAQLDLDRQTIIDTLFEEIDFSTLNISGVPARKFFLDIKGYVETVDHQFRFLDTVRNRLNHHLMNCLRYCRR
jgi:hypothetical protein